MKSYYFSKFNKNKKHPVIHHPVSLVKIDDISSLVDDSELANMEWENKARLLQIRRWRKIKGQLV